MSEKPELSTEAHHELANRIYAAIRSGVGIDPPSDTINYNLEDAYLIRRLLVDRLIADGAFEKGHKIGFTSLAMQEMYGMSGPDFGQLLSNMIEPEGYPVAIGHLCDTRVEPELAFEMRESIEGLNVTADEVLKVTAKIYPAIEVIDSRVGAVRARAVDSIADNAGAGKVVLGSLGFAPSEYDLAEIPVTMTVDGESLQGRGADVMGHPAEAVAWLVRRLTEIEGLGGRINAGDIVMSGSFTRSVAVEPGSRLSTTFGAMGKLDVDFV